MTKFPKLASRNKAAIAIILLALSIAAARLYFYYAEQKSGPKNIPATDEADIRLRSQRVASMTEQEREEFIQKAICTEGRATNAANTSYLAAVEEKTRLMIEARGEDFKSQRWQKSVTTFRSKIAQHCPDVW